LYDGITVLHKSKNGEIRLKKAQQARSVDAVPVAEPVASEQTELKPQGIGMAVAFDWGLAVQLLVTPFLTSQLGDPGFYKSFKGSPVPTSIIYFLISLPFVALLAVFGEGVRRGWRWTRSVQIGANVLGIFGGFYSLFSLWQSSKQGNYWPVVPTIILLIFSPLIAWRLSRPATRKWFATTKSVEARKRHGGAWPWLILSWSIAGGVLQALEVIFSNAH